MGSTVRAPSGCGSLGGVARVEVRVPMDILRRRMPFVRAILPLVGLLLRAPLVERVGHRAAIKVFGDRGRDITLLLKIEDVGGVVIRRVADAPRCCDRPPLSLNALVLEEGGWGQKRLGHATL